MQNIGHSIKMLEKLFDVINEQWYDGELKRPVITIAPRGKEKAYGWCTTWEAWTDGTENSYEINICADYTDRPFIETIGTMMHEMVHLYNITKGVQDCSRSGMYHNKKFKDEAERRGLLVEKNPKYGWALTRISPETYKKFSENGYTETTLLQRREAEKPKSKKAKSYKHTCQVCGNIARTTKYIKLICGDCWNEDEQINYMTIEQTGGDED